MLPTKFRYIWLSGFREDFLEIEQPETRIAYGALFSSLCHHWRLSSFVRYLFTF